MVTISNPSVSMKVRLISFHILQLRGEAGQMQVKYPAIGLVHNVGVKEKSSKKSIQSKLLRTGWDNDYLLKALAS